MGEGNFSRVSLFAGVCLSLGPADGCSGALVLSELVMFFGGACLSVCTPESVLQSVTPSEREGNLTRLASTVCSVCCFEPLGRATHPGIVLEFLGPICTASSWHGGILRGSYSHWSGGLWMPWLCLPTKICWLCTPVANSSRGSAPRSHSSEGIVSVV